MRKVTVYRDDSTTQVVYENVKHLFWTAGAHRYIQWPRERICWFKDEKVADGEKKV